MRCVGCVEGGVSEVALEFGGWIPSGGRGGCCALLGPGRERLRIVSYFCDFWVVGCGSALPFTSNFCTRAIFATVSKLNFKKMNISFSGR
jgi:hypothetical protein